MILQIIKNLFGITSEKDIVNAIDKLKDEISKEDITEEVVELSGSKQFSKAWSEASTEFSKTMTTMANNGSGSFAKLASSSGKFFSTLWSGLSVVSKISLIIAAIAGVATIAYKIYDKINISVDEATNTLQEFNEQFKSSKNEYDSHAELVGKVSDSYDELSKKVNTDTNFNLGLDDGEYQDFINMNNELAEAFPLLVKGYDESGNAIIDFGNDCASTTEKLNKLLEAEKQSMNMEIAKNLPEYFTNTKTVLEGYEEDIEEQEQNIERLKETQELIHKLNNNEMGIFEQREESYNIDTVPQGQLDKFREITQNATYEFVNTLSDIEKANAGVFDVDDLIVYDGYGNFWLEYYKLTPELQSRLQDIISDNVSSLTGSVNDELLDAQNNLATAKSSKEASWSDFTQNLVSGMQSKSTYQALSEEGQQLATTLVQSLDSSVAAEMDEEDPYAYVRDNILTIFNGLSNEDVSTLNKALSEYISLDMSEMTISGQDQAREAIKQAIYDLLPEDKAEQLIITLGLDVETPVQTAYNSLMKDLDAKYGEGYSESSLTQNSLNYYFDKLGINTKEEIESFQKLFNETGNLTEAFKKYEEAIEKTNEALVESKGLSFSEQMSNVQALSKGLDQLDSIMADVINGEDFDYSSILNNTDFTETFGEYEDEYEKFIETVTNSPDDISRCQDAFDELATAYVYSKDALQDLSRETQNAAILELDQMGIENAEEVVTNMLSGYEEAMQLAEAANIDFANATAEEIYSLQGLEAEFANAGEAAFNYYLRKKLVSEGSINTVADINALIALAQQCQVTGKNLELLIKLRNIYNVIESDMWGDATKKLAAEEASKLTAELMTLSVTTVKFAGGAQTAAAKQEKLADATDKATDALEKEKEKLEDLKNEYDELYDAIQWFYDKLIDKIDKKIEAIEKENEALEKQQENMDKILAAIESNYDAEIKLIQDKIDALQDENDEEERALALEEAKRKLQEAKSRKTLMVYQKGVGFTYQVDTKSIKEAEDELEELQENEVVSELEKQIEKLEEAKEKWSEIPDAYEKAMQEIAAMNYFGKNWKDITLNPSDELLNSFEGKYTGIQSSIEKNESRIESYEKEKEAIEELKQAWEDAKNAYQYSQYEAKLSSFFGSDYEYQLLHNSAGWRRKFADEYSSICSQIEALEERIKASNESTASSTEESAGRVAGAAKKVGESTKDIKFEIDNTALEEAKLKLEQLDYQISTGQQGLETARNAVANFIKQYEAADGCTTITEELSKSVDELGRIYGGTGDKMADTISGISSDIETFKVQSQTMSQNLTDVDEKLQSISNSESQVESNVNAELSEVDQTILNLKKNIDDLKLALQELETFKTSLNTLVTDQVLDTSVLTADTMARVTEIQTAVSTLFVSIGTLGNALETLSGQMQTLDSYTLNNLIMSLGQGGEEGGSGLFAAIQNIITLISNEETGLLALLGRINTSDLTAIIASFNGEAGLLPAITAVSNAIFVEGDEDGVSLYSVINKLIETIPTITSVRSSFSELVGTLAVCNSQVNSLKKAIDELPTEKTITITVNKVGSVPDDFEGSGTARFGSGTAHINESGNAYFKGTGNIGLRKDQPNSLVGELGTELKVSKDGSYELVTSPTIMDLEKGDMIFNHEQTEEILKHGNRSNVAKLDSKAKSAYTKLTGSAFTKGTMNENVFNAIMHGLQFVMNPVDMMPKFAHGINSMPEARNEQNFNVTIGDIYLNGVQDTNGLARAIKDKLPRLMVQELGKR